MMTCAFFRNAMTLATFAWGSTITCAVEESPGSGQLSTSLLSAYVSEGREAYAGSAALEGVASLTWDAWSFAAGYITALSNDGAELCCELGWERALGTGTLGVGVSHIRDSYDGVSAADSELGLGYAWPVTEELELLVAATYAIDAKGAYGTLGMNYALLTTPTVELLLTGSVSWNDGYHDAGGFRGADVILAGAELNVPLTTRWHVGGFVQRAWALRGVLRDGGEDLVYGGLSLTATF